MSHGFELNPSKEAALPQAPGLSTVGALLAKVNRGLLALSMMAMVATALILTYSVVSRYFFHAPTDWQDEASIFMLVGVTFFCCAYVQSLRGHIGIEALAAILPPKANAVRLFIVDLLSFLFCAFFSWKSWTLWHEAWVDGQTTTSTFAPPLWIPYSMMAAGMTLLTLQILLQVLARITDKGAAK
ncbi:TRAP-type C4-dicarboxylate transport system, small permease component [Duganella sp. CF458]|uniref:TRAP transporter small permease n=1 Tax=Duganella sp. CF458 TaxID=1884368 RepID=UPI0008F0B929|nr:TRAP transporter small permease [Duganella sp. CF458]SFF76940.1 TRAP-type C4-dicarboxylate transport system, small permease component [Duganella sp. CF458]